MNIRTIGQVNALDCCPCDFPTCNEPRKECESKSVTKDAVGWSINNYISAFGILGKSGYDPSDQMCEELVKTYMNVTVVVVFSSTYPDAEGATTTFTTAVADGAEYNIFGNPVPRTDTGTETSGEGVDSYSAGVFSGTVVSEYEADEVTYYDTYETTITFSNLVETEDVVTGAMALLDEEEWSEGSCVSSATESFPICDDEPTDSLIAVVFTLARYRFAPPLDYDRSTWAMEWDLVTASPEWWEWYDAGATGTEPTPGPSLVSHEAWVWDGIDEWSEWFEIPLPTETGETRVVNVQTVCWKSTRIGTKPFLSGDEVALPE